MSLSGCESSSSDSNQSLDELPPKVLTFKESERGTSAYVIVNLENEYVEIYLEYHGDKRGYHRLDYTGEFPNDITTIEDKPRTIHFNRGENDFVYSITITDINGFSHDRKRVTK